jgi:DNA-binding XRE family transcriptional regulator
MTQAQAAQIAGVHEVTYQRYEAGSIEPKGKVLLPLARAWDKTLDWFYQNGSEDTAVSAEAKEG